MEDVKEILEDNVEETTLPKKPKQKNGFKTKKCKVISYDKRTKRLDVDFDGYGVRITNVEDFEGEFASIKYKGEIGNPNFECKF